MLYGAAILALQWLSSWRCCWTPKGRFFCDLQTVIHKSVCNTQTRKRVTTLPGSIFIHNRTALLCPLRILMAKRHHAYSNILILSYVILRVKQYLFRVGQGLRAPWGWGFQISWQSAHADGKVVSPKYRPPLPSRKHPWYTFLLDPRAIVSMKNSNDTLGNRTRDLPACSAAP